MSNTVPFPFRLRAQVNGSFGGGSGAQTPRPTWPRQLSASPGPRQLSLPPQTKAGGMKQLGNFSQFRDAHSSLFTFVHPYSFLLISIHPPFHLLHPYSSLFISIPPPLLLSISFHLYPFLFILIHLCPPLFIFAHLCSSVPISTHVYLFISIHLY